MRTENAAIKGTWLFAHGAMLTMSHVNSHSSKCRTCPALLDFSDLAGNGISAWQRLSDVQTDCISNIFVLQYQTPNPYSSECLRSAELSA